MKPSRKSSGRLSLLGIITFLIWSSSTVEAVYSADDTSDTAQNPVAEIASDAEATTFDAEQPPEASTDDTTAEESFEGLGQLPWTTGDDGSGAATNQKATQVSEYFNTMGESELNSFFDHAPVELENESLIKLFYSIRRVGMEALEPLAQPLDDLRPLIEDPKAFRIQLFQLRARVHRVQVHELSPAFQTTFEIKQLFQLSMTMEGQPNPIVAFARRIPKQWELDKEVDYPSGLFGLFVQVGEKQGELSEVVFAADRAAWYPVTPSAQPAVDPDHVLLAKLGMDVGLLDDVRSTNRRSISVVSTANASIKCWPPLVALTPPSFPAWSVKNFAWNRSCWSPPSNMDGSPPSPVTLAEL